MTNEKDTTLQEEVKTVSTEPVGNETYWESLCTKVVALYIKNDKFFQDAKNKLQPEWFGFYKQVYYPVFMKIRNEWKGEALTPEKFKEELKQEFKLEKELEQFKFEAWCEVVDELFKLEPDETHVRSKMDEFVKEVRTGMVLFNTKTSVGKKSLSPFATELKEILDFKFEEVEIDKPQSLFEILAEPEEITNSIISPIFQEGDKSILIATWKLGKTLLDTQLALCASKPTSFLGYPVTQPRNVLYVRFELKKPRFKIRLHQMMKGMNHDFAKVPEFHLYRGFDLLEQKYADWLYYMIEQYQIELLIMEPMYKMTNLPLNKPESAGPILRALEQIQIRFPKLHIHIAHHERRLPPGAQKGDVDERSKVYGPMQIYADMDWQLFLSSDKDKDDPTFTLSFLSNDVDIHPIKLKRDPFTLLYFPISETNKDEADWNTMSKVLNDLVKNLGDDPTHRKFKDACQKAGVNQKRFDLLTPVEAGKRWTIYDRGNSKRYHPLTQKD